MFKNEEDVKDLENLSNMVEKIRESHQRHARNISSVSEISTTGSSSDPLKPDENAEIRVVILCDSEIEKKCVREAFNSLICDDQSDIKDAKYSRHRWDSNEECTGMPSCFFCIREPETMTFRHQNSDSGLRSVSTAPSNFGDGFFRFTMEDTTYRVMLLSKDKQNLLKIIHYNFLVVGMQVKDSLSNFDEEIWDIEFKKRLERYSKKAIAPIILMGYCRDISRLGPIKRGPQKDKIIDDCKSKIKKIGKKRKAIPRFVDFVEGTSEQLCVIFRDVERLFKHPGYRLQQCAYVNNALHFGTIIENPDVTMADLCYPEGETEDSPIMIAAKLRHKDVLNAFLRSNKFDHENCDTEILEQVIHYRNKLGQSLLHAVALQGPELEEQKLQILRKEIKLHVITDIEQFHVTEQINLQRCLRQQLKSSAEAAIILDQSRALQGIPKTDHELKMEKGKVWSRLFFASLLLMLIFNAIDTGSDILIVIRYYYEMYPNEDKRLSSTMPCGEVETNLTANNINCDNITGGQEISIQCIPNDMTGDSKFAYTLFFLLVPWPFFIYEFFTSRQYEQLVAKKKEIVNEIAKCSGFMDVMSWYLQAIGYVFFFLCCLVFWPIAVLFIKYYNDGKYYLAKGEQRSAREKKIESSEVLWQTARVMEVSLESSFQPTIQLYIIFPVLVKNLTNTTFNFNVFTICKYDELNFPIIKADQTISIVTSILSLAWCFTSYHATLKRGALDKDLAALFYRAVLFLSVLFQILGRLFIFVIFSYSFGPGNYDPLLFFLGAHIVLMSILHFVFSDAKIYWQKGGILNLSFFHYMLGNGLANIYIHNWIRMDPLRDGSRPLQHVSTLVRQLIMDLVFVAENLTLLFIGLNSDITEIKQYKITFAIVLLGFSFVGLILKCVYYRYLHIWAWLIMDYTIKIEDGHWKCSLLSDMYLCGNLKERNLTLFYIPARIYKFLKYCCGDDSLKCGEHHCSRCSAIITVFLVPIAIVTGLIALTLLLVVLLLFLPIFIVLILPCVVVAKCRNIKTGPIKINEFMEEGVPLKDVSAGSTTVNGDVVHADHGEDNDGPNGDVINPTEEVIEEQPRAAQAALQEQV